MAVRASQMSLPASPKSRLPASHFQPHVRAARPRASFRLRRETARFASPGACAGKIADSGLRTAWLQNLICAPPSAPLSPLAGHRPKPEVRIRGNVMNSPISDWPISDFSITDCKIASHSACRRDNAMKPPLILWRRRSRQGYYGSLA